MYINNLQLKKNKQNNQIHAYHWKGCDVKQTPASSVGKFKLAKVKGKQGGNHSTSAAQATQLPGEEVAQTELTKDIF